MRDYVAIYQRFADDALAGRLNLGRLQIQAIERQARDLRRAAEDPDYPFVWLPGDAPQRGVEDGAKVCAFLEEWCHIKGPKEGTRLVLDPWQVWIFVVLFGWRRKEDHTRRRFRRAQLWLCRGQGKSFLAALLALYFLAIDGKGAEVQTAATTREQARLVFDVAKWCVRKNPNLASELGIKPGEHTITCGAGVLKPVSRESGASEGANASLVVCDELHAHPSRDLHDTLSTGCMKRPTSLFLVVSTAPTELAGIGYEQWDYCRKILSRAIEDDLTFALIVAADTELDAYDVRTLEQANPGIDISVDRDSLLGAMSMAKNAPSFRPAYMSRHLGWVRSQAVPYITAEAWDACAEEIDPGIWADNMSFVGVDLASRSDLACWVQVARKYIADVAHYYVRGRYYVSQQAVDEALHAQYRGWADEGYLTVHPGAVTDFDAIEADILEIARSCPVWEIGADKWQATHMIEHLSDAGYVCLEVPQSSKNLSAPAKDLEALVKERRIHHDGNPVLGWTISNVVIELDARDNYVIKKSTKQAKIDGAIALITAHSRALVAPEDAGSGAITFL